MVLPGKIAKERRQAFAQLLRRYHAGDLQLIAEIQANAASNAAMHRLARDAMVPNVAGDKRRELEAAEAEEDGDLNEEEAEHTRKCGRTDMDEAVTKSGALRANLVASVEQLAVCTERLAEVPPEALRVLDTISNFAGCGTKLRETFEIFAEGTLKIASTKAQADEIGIASEENKRQRYRKMDEDDAAHRVRLAREYPLPAANNTTNTTNNNNNNPNVDAGVLTVRAIANKHDLLGEVAAEDREMVLSDAGRRAAAAFRESGGIELPRVLEIQSWVCAYPAAYEDGLITAIEAAIEERGRATGPLHIEVFRPLIPRFIKKRGEISRILAEAERLAAQVVFCFLLL